MSLTIDEPPDILACSACSQPLDWVWRVRDQRYYAICRWDGHPDPTVVKLHTCPLPRVPKIPYRLHHQPAEVWERGRKLARAVLATKAKERTRKATRRG
jgi:hypothetical protein